MKQMFYVFGRNIPELHDDLVLSEAAERFGLSKGEIEDIFNKVEKRKIEMYGVDDKTIGEILARTLDVINEQKIKLLGDVY